MSKIDQNGTAYELIGPKNAAVVVLVHGLGLTRQIWERYVPVFEKQFRVLTYDLCGHGKSALPEHTPSLTLLSKQLRALLDELLIERCAIVGFSLGGMINRRFAMDYPSRVRALVILNSPHERSPEAQRLVEKRAAETKTGGAAFTIETTLERWFTQEFRKSNPNVIKQVRNVVLANDPENYTKHRQVLASGVAELIRPQPPITVPCLIMTCENDSGSTPIMSCAIASEISNSRTIIVPDLQHMGLVEQPKLFIDPILQFLKATLQDLETSDERDNECRNKKVATP